MTFKSADCKGCGNSVRHLAATTETSRWMSQAVILSANGDQTVGEIAPDENLKGKEVWHRACWMLADRPDSFTGPSGAAYDQGYFVGEFHPPAPLTTVEVCLMSAQASVRRAKFRSEMDMLLASLKGQS